MKTNNATKRSPRTNIDVPLPLPALGVIVVAVDAMGVGDEITAGAVKLKVYVPTKGTSLAVKSEYATV